MNIYNHIKSIFVKSGYNRQDLLNAILKALYKSLNFTSEIQELNSKTYEILDGKKRYMVWVSNDEFAESVNALRKDGYVNDLRFHVFKLSHDGVVFFENGGYKAKQKAKAAKLKTPIYANWKYILGIIGAALTILYVLIRLNLI